MTGHSRLSLLLTVSCLAGDMRRRHACAHVAVWPAVVPDGNVDGNADDRSRRRAEQHQAQRRGHSSPLTARTSRRLP